MGKRILILSNHFITLYNFRNELIERLNVEGHKVYISIPQSDENKYFEKMGCEIIETPVDRRGINPVRDIDLFIKYIRIMKKIKPDIVFSYTIKPNIYGSIASNITKNKQVNNITGTGAIFLKRNLVSEVAKLLYKMSIKNSYKIFFQNSGDKDFFVNNNMVKENYDILPGSGVNLEQFQVSDFPTGQETNFIFMGRIMALKGIDQYLETAKAVKIEYPNTNFFVAGFIEEEKYKPIIGEYDSRGIIKYLGFQKDIRTWIEKCHCTILPSHGGEGIPNVLLESAAMGRVCIASSINGSKDVIDDGVTGYLFETGSTLDLTNIVKRFLELSFENKVRMGLAGRAKVEREFDRKIVIDKYLDEINK
ncbi:MAG: glycosyltransferase family 4 protein [Gudongella sp.]|jgi:galacturonosyltransferase|nr:glycosyltransferase family 4 protein [Gudongella sp.]